VRSPLRKLLLGVAIGALVLVGCCRFLLPERFAVNAPVAHILLGRGIDAPAQAQLDERIQVPPGFHFTRFAEGLPNVRFLRFTPAGDLLASQPRESRVVLLERDRNGDGRSDGVRTLLEGLNRPHGMDLRDGWLYVAETDAIGRIRFDPDTGKTEGKFERIVTGIPGGENHWTRTLRFGPDGMMYVSVGSSCNVCLEKDERRAAMLRFQPDGSGGEIYARGLRNSVGFDWQPGSGKLYATDNGRDLLGDGFPPCELNEIQQGAFYGWPFANGDRVPDPDFGAGHETEIAASTPPVHAFQPHNAPLGMTFIRSPDAPAALQNAALVALHGSWNRTRKDGYKVVSLRWGADGKVEERDFMTGFERDGDVIGRPVDVIEGPDGAIYVTDDYAGSVYRVASGTAPAARSAETAAAPAAAAASPLAALSAEEITSSSARGQALFDANACGGCHVAAQARSGMVVRPLRELAARYSIDALVALLAAPTPPMPVAPLSDAERRDVAIYLLSSHP
jgi:glucose/arabinose dehydrogenase/cytochrome c551/c552